MKLVIQIPCLNEEKTLPVTLSQLPRRLQGVTSVEWLIVDDGSTDRTVEVAQAGGVDHIVSLGRNRGLARAFSAGLEHSIAVGADIVVTLDADNQYFAGDIGNLIAPILSNRADIVVGARPIDDIKHFSPAKKFFQRMGSRLVRLLSGTDIPDAPSGFRAFSRSAAKQINIFNAFTYTLEMVLQAGHDGTRITHVPIRTNSVLRPSRLFGNIAEYMLRSAWLLIRVYMTYQPFRFFAVPGMVALLLGLATGVRYLVLNYLSPSGGHVHSVVLCALLLSVGFSLVVAGLIADLISVNRKLLQKTLLRLSQTEEQLAERNSHNKWDDRKRSA